MQLGKNISKVLLYQKIKLTNKPLFFYYFLIIIVTVLTITFAFVILNDDNLDKVIDDKHIVRIFNVTDVLSLDREERLDALLHSCVYENKNTFDPCDADIFTESLTCFFPSSSDRIEGQYEYCVALMVSESWNGVECQKMFKVYKNGDTPDDSRFGVLQYDRYERSFCSQNLDRLHYEQDYIRKKNMTSGFSLDYEEYKMVLDSIELNILKKDENQ